MQLENRNIKVAVYMITYNHEAYIQEAIESVLMQKTNFKYKLIIGEDFSTDNTRNICVDYAKKYPDAIELILQPKNIGAVSNAQNIFKKCFESNAKYVAMLEGDDYWTDPLKLQKQFEFLEHNSGYSMCFHNVDVLNMNYKFEKQFIHEERKDFTIADLINFDTWFIQTGSIFYLNNFLVPIPSRKIIGGDVLLCSILAHKGKIHLLEETMSVYRKHEGGLTNNKINENWLYNVVDRVKYLDSYFNYQYHELYKKELYNTFGKLALSNSHVGKFSTFYFLTLCFFKVSNFKNLRYFFQYYFKNSFINFINFILKRNK